MKTKFYEKSKNGLNADLKRLGISLLIDFISVGGASRMSRGGGYIRKKSGMPSLCSEYSHAVALCNVY